MLQMAQYIDAAAYDLKSSTSSRYKAGEFDGIACNAIGEQQQLQQCGRQAQL